MAKKKRFKFEFKFDKKKTKPLLIFLIILSVGALLFNIKGWFIAAVVNGRPITRYYLNRQLEKQLGQQMLENQVAEILIAQAGKQEKIEISQDEIQARVTELENQFKDQGTDLDSFLALQGQTRKSLLNSLKLQLTVEKILGKDIEVTDEQIAAYFEKNKEFYGEDADLETMKEDLQKELYQQAMSEKFTPWLEELKKQAKIYYFLNFAANSSQSSGL